MGLRLYYQFGTVELDKRVNIWYFRWREGTTQKSKPLGTKEELATYADAYKAAEPLRQEINNARKRYEGNTVARAVQLYIDKEMPTNRQTRTGYLNYLKNYVLPQWGDTDLVKLDPLEIRTWLRSLDRSPKTVGHIRSVMRHSHREERVHSIRSEKCWLTPRAPDTSRCAARTLR